MFTQFAIGGISLDAAGLVALADLDTIARRTALIGGASFLDVLYLAPGIHCQQKATELNGGEYPTTGAMHNGYVFRIENQATVSYLQRVGRPGHLTTVNVSTEEHMGLAGLFGVLWRTERLATLLFFVSIAANFVVIALLGKIRDWWALGILGMLVLARLLNVIVIKLRLDKNGFKGAKEKGDEDGDLLILLSQDRWVRMRGRINDIKVVTAGQWLTETEKPQSFVVSFGTLLVYGAAALAGNASTVGSLLVALLLLFSVGVLGLVNAATKTLHMFGRTVEVGDSTRYPRRLKMVEALLVDHPNKEWAINMGLITRDQQIPSDAPAPGKSTE
ncbi:uncharacterized protein PHACADRAFT_253492 [Phanerochaete carnosa HHB-10118-sp]|uniref:Uncharacterized protein n=1 Tax=Phanerochaete carnosa (strain HHB-10118-sp) TaxID=650164 RepID=K5V1M9_PHACS|nr:uncharacterized protein PHACADRAFT_253492 [Phanerochaete carnosa HHB-10118-sp]EKM56401.1 hypothetical protein PHACADRAFT_253492 [Phanerochaete carnosa HHB-10118-sp]